jgi:exosortase O
MNNPLFVKSSPQFQDFFVKHQPLAIALLVIGAWLGVNISNLGWLFLSINQTSGFNKILMLSVGLGMLIWGGYQQFSQSLEFSNVIKLPIKLTKAQTQPLILLFTTALGAIALQWLIDLPQITAFLFLLGSYGLAGLFLDLSTWRRGLAIASITALVIPFSLQFTSGLGFAARVFTSYAVEQILVFGHIAAISSHDIIILENGIAQVDLPCSGLRSLWMGTLFLLGATWLEGRKLGWRWLAVYGGCLGLLTLANVGRVLLLVITNFVIKQPLWAEMIHIPVGLGGFLGACGLTWLALRWVPSIKEFDDKFGHKSSYEFSHDKSLSSYPHPSRLSLSVLVISILFIGLIPRPPVFALTPWLPQIPEVISTQPVSLSNQESDFFGTEAIATKQRFKFGNLTGSMLLVNSSSWRTQHPPELCLRGSGLKVNTMASQNMSKDFPLRWLSLENGKMSAMYWFQSPNQTTDELLTRMWSETRRGDRPWIMVSVLFDRSQSSDSSEVQNFALTLRQAIASQI